LSQPASPSPEALAAELAGTLRSGLTTQALRDCPGILGLAVTAAKSASPDLNDRATAAVGIVREAAVRVDARTNGPASTLLALAQGTRGSLLKDRRIGTADLLNVSPEHFRKDREESLIEAVADEPYAIDSAWRLRQGHRTTPERQPTDTRVGINWLERHQAYRRVWTPVSALRDDLVVLLEFIRQDAEWPDIADRVMNQLWRYAQFSRELERFVKDYGGLWLLADIDSEVAAADAIRRIAWHTQLGEADNSWLRLILGEAPQEELDRFIDRMLSEQRGKEMMEVWLTWAKSCTCDLEAPNPEHCEVHRWMAACDEFVKLIDKDWYRIADYYRTSEGNIHGVDVRELWQRRDPSP
jgi:hypothetical protein